MIKSIPLSEIVSLSKGTKVSYSPVKTNSSKRFIQIDDLRNDSNLKFTEEAGTYVQRNDVVIAWDGANAGTIGHNLEGVIGSTLVRLKIKDIQFHSSFISRFLKSKSSLLRSKCTGATIPHIDGKTLKSLPVLCLSAKEQDDIVSVLDRADSLRQKRRESIKLLDEFLRSTFLEMFGEFEKKKWPQLKMIELAEKKKGSMRTGPFGSSLLHSEFVKEGIAVLGIDNAVENYFTWKERRFIAPEKYEKLKQYTVYPEDIIITIMGTLGRSAVVPDNIPTAINTKHLACITIDKKIANPYFVVYSVQSDPDVVHQLNSKRRGAIMDGLNLTIIKHLRFNLPPLALQETFVGIMKQTEALKKKLETSQAELDNQFNALMQRYFG